LHGMHLYAMSPTNDLDQFDFVFFRLTWVFVEVHYGFADAAVAQWISMDHSELQRRDGQVSCMEISVTCWRILMSDSRILVLGRLLSGRGLNQS
jgi:hypothetical protein